MKEIEIVSPTGARGFVPETEVESALAQGARYVTPEEVKEEQDQIKYGNQTAKALLYAGARGLSLGLSDQILAKTGLVDQEELKGIKDFNEAASIAGEVGGAVLPALFTGGTSVAARVAAATPAGIAANLATRTGSKVAQKVAQSIVGNGVKQSIAKKAAELGTAGLIEGALFGEAQLVTEEALGDAEFTAESILGAAGTGAAYGAGGGVALGAIAGAAERGLGKIAGKYKERLINKRTDLTDIEKADLIKRVKEDDAMLGTIRLTQKQGVAQAAEELGIQPTPGMLSAEPAIGSLESSIGGGASLPAVQIRTQREAIEEGLQEAIKKPLGEAGEIARVDAGDAIKLGLRDQMLADLGDAPQVFSATLEQYGKLQPNERIMKLIPSRIRKTDSYKVLLKPEKSQVEELMGMLQRAENINQVNAIKKNIGQRLAEANRQGQRSLADAMSDLYRTAGRAEEEAIELGAKLTFGKDQKAIDMWTTGWTDAKKRYADFYGKYKDFAAELGIKGKSAQNIIDQLADAKPEDLARKFLDLNDAKKAQKIAQEFPDAFDVARRYRFSEFLRQSKNGDGSVSFKRFFGKLEKLDETQKKILLGDESQKILKNVKTLVDALPPNINPSGTDFANAWRSILSPIYQATEYARYALYKGGAKGLRDYFDKGLPALAAAEQAKNRATTKINSASKNFFKATRQAVTYSTADQMSESQIKRAQKTLEMLQTSPEDFLDDLARRGQQFNTFMPNTGSALQARVIAATQFLSEKFPKRQDYILNDDYQAPKSEVTKFNDYLQAVEKPFKVIEQLESGYINPRAIETLKVVYPKLFAQLQQDLTKNMPKKITPQQRNQLFYILGAKTTAITQPQNMAILQGQGPQEVEQQAPQPSGKVPVSAAKNLKSASRAQSDFDRVAQRRA